MLRRLVLHDVGPAHRLAMDPVAERVNLITGDNGLGKSFLLEAAWWALTRTWHETPAVPSSPKAKIEHHFDSTSGVSKTDSTWDPKGQSWKRSPGKPPNPGLVLYARVDGSFSVWDPVRNYRLYKRADGDGASPQAYQLSSSEVLRGLRRKTTLAGVEHTETLCLGLIDDWREWQQAHDPRFEMLRELLAHLGAEDEPLTPGDLMQPTVDDVRKIPTVRMRYQQDVPITYAPAGVQRMVKLAYIFAWVVSAHLDEVARQNEGSTKDPFRPADQLIVLLDEPETHLHPRWQRTVLPSLLRALQRGWGAWSPRVQLIAATHSPLVLASMEPTFVPTLDALWKLDLVDGKVQIERDRWRRRGEVGDWLTSDVFDLAMARSREAEGALRQAMALTRSGAVSADQIRQVTTELHKVLSDTDRAWVRWSAFAHEHGVEV